MTNAQLHIAHRDEYLRGRRDGHADALAGRDYRPRDGATGAEAEQHAYGLGYSDGHQEGNPCSSGTCDYSAHQKRGAACT